MAITEKYVTTTGAGAHDGTSEANAWSLTEAIAAAAAGNRVNVKAGTYTLGAGATFPAGTVAAPIIWRGYSSTIGDLTVAACQSAATLAIDIREKRRPIAAAAAPPRTHASAARKQGMPPIHAAAPIWCSAVASASGSRP